MSQWAKLAEEQGEVVRKIKEEIKADPASHTKEELDEAVAKLKELKAKADDPMNALEDPVTKVSVLMACEYGAHSSASAPVGHEPSIRSHRVPGVSR